MLELRKWLYCRGHISSLEAILSQLFVYVYTAIIATILAERLWGMDSAAALKCNGYGLESLMAGPLIATSFLKH